MGHSFELSGLRAEPGSMAKGHLGFVRLADGTRVGMPVALVNGAEPGPTLLVTASVHGSEISGTGALIRVIRRLRPAELRGRLIAITVASPFAFQVGTYGTPFISPTDGLNIGSIVDLRAQQAGRLTERLAGILAPAVEAASHWIDVHSNPDLAIPFTLINPGLSPDDTTAQTIRTMATAWGNTVIEAESGRPGILSESGVARGIPTINPELTGDMFLRDDNTVVGEIGITNVMKAIGMLDGDLTPQPHGRLEGDFVYHGRLTTETGGLMWVRRQPGEFIPAGDVVIELTDVWGDTVEEIRMPVDGYCWSFTGGISGSHAVTEGTAIAYVFRRRTDTVERGQRDRAQIAN